MHGLLDEDGCLYNGSVWSKAWMWRDTHYIALYNGSNAAETVTAASAAGSVLQIIYGISDYNSGFDGNTVSAVLQPGSIVCFKMLAEPITGLYNNNILQNRVCGRMLFYSADGALAAQYCKDGLSHVYTNGERTEATGKVKIFRWSGMQPHMKAITINERKDND